LINQSIFASLVGLGPKDDHVLHARFVREDPVRAVKKDRSLLRGDASDVDPRVIGDGTDLLICTQCLSINHRIGKDHYATSVWRQGAPEFVEHRSDLRTPQLSRFMGAQVTVLAAGPNFTRFKSACPQSQPFNAMDVMIQVVVDAGIGGRGDDEIDRVALHLFQGASVATADVGPAGSLGQPRAVVVQSVRQLFGLFYKELNRKTRSKSTWGALTCCVAF
jgi:hypothetical protein